ncbi:hypothetical protein [Enterobacter phage vB_ExiM_F5M1E]|nr:hypothetical protein [Enterobacter phage vB_ExiM_F1M1E]UNA03095.1 hypothetical protein [Enterobacter phage vB_ExiM_F2M1E]UNA03416.1 hypothetical protein [Enterobacter phage vB_ExiM_F4M1E]UNA03737.1 hypothetical protein [Enterobacter phage vB_ExiM_F5M1E]UNA04057.1 hypothetical protein [Pantoea phage vB_PdiM_F5M2A]
MLYGGCKINLDGANVRPHNVTHRATQRRPQTEKRS